MSSRSTILASVTAASLLVLGASSCTQDGDPASAPTATVPRSATVDAGPAASTRPADPAAAGTPEPGIHVLDPTTAPPSPSEGAQRTLVLAGQYAQAGNGFAALVTAGASTPNRDGAATEVAIDRLIVGAAPAGGVATISVEYAGVDLVPGSRHLVVVGPSPPGDTYAYLEEGTLFDEHDGVWVQRGGALRLTDAEAEAVFAESVTQLAAMDEASRATLTVEPTGSPDEVRVAGYGIGRPIVLELCVVHDDTVQSTAGRSCDPAWTEEISPRSSSFTAAVLLPDELDLGDGETADCATDDCALVVHDQSFPASGVTIHRP